MLKAVALSAETLASVLERTVDCVKLIGLDGSIRWMNVNGIASLECADFARLKGTPTVAGGTFAASNGRRSAMGA